jgi:hypothetical protein
VDDILSALLGHVKNADSSELTMNTTKLNRCLKPLAWILVIVIIVMLLIPAELTDEQLSQIKPGMSILQVKRLLGEPFEGEWSSSSHDGLRRIVELGDANNIGFKLTHYGQFWKPTMTVTCSGVSEFKEHSIWIGKTHMLWVEHNKNIVVNTGIFPITRSAGGFQGCIDSLKHYWKYKGRPVSTSPS